MPSESKKIIAEVSTGSSKSLAIRVGCFPTEITLLPSEAGSRTEIGKSDPDWFRKHPLQIAAGYKKGKKVKVGVKGPSCQYHPVISIGSKDIQPESKVRNELEFTAVATRPEALSKKSKVKRFFHEEIWPKNIAPNEYHMVVETCDETQKLAVEAFYGAQYTLEFSRRSASSWSHKEGSFRSDEPESVKYSGGQKIDQKTGKKVDDDRSKFSLKLSKDSEDVTRQGQFDSIAKSVETFLKVWELVSGDWKDAKVQWGWGFEFQLDLLQGSISVGWGYQENPDHRIFWGYEYALNLTIVAGRIEISFGAELSWRGKGIVFKAFVAFQADIKLVGRVKKEAIDKTTKEIPLEGTPEVETGLKLKVLSDKLLNAIGKIKTGYKLKGQAQMLDKGFAVKYETQFEGIIAIMQITALNGMIEGKKKYTLLKEGKTKTHYLPSQD